MDLIRIGEKVLSWEKINREIAKILRLRTGGLTQGEVARKLGIERTFVSRMESLGEIRRGKKVALVGFPIKNKEKLLLLAKEVGVDFTLLLTQKERFEFIENKTKSDLFNQIISIITRLIDFDLIVFLGSDKRVEVAEKLFSIQVIGVVIGESPITEDKYVDPEMILEILKEVKVFSIDRRRDQ
ncbi:MAG: helix-turn-helix domain-containing protein [Atribacterota bacterium]